MAKNNNVGIVDVAKMCNTSVASVSYAFSRRKPVSKETRKKILQVAKEMGYKPNSLASSFRRGKTDVIALLVDTLDSPFFAYWATSLERAAREKGFKFWLANTEGDKGLASDYIDEFRSMKIGGLVVSSASVSDEQIMDLCEEQWNVITPSREIDGIDTCPVDIDFNFGIKQAVDYLYSLGHRNIGFISGPEVPTCIERLEAFKEYCRLYGINIDDRHIVYGTEGIGTGAAEARQLLESVDNLTAIISSCDTMAFAAMHTTASMGLMVPKDISIIGFDDIPYASLWQPALTTVSTDIPKHARIIINCLVGDFKEKCFEDKITIKPELVIRDTCAEPNMKRF